MTISLRPGVKDIQSEAILKTANSNVDLGNNQLYNLTMGKWFVIECEDNFDIDNLCNKLLANSVIENYEIEDLPQVLQPKSGYIYNANHSPFKSSGNEDNPIASNFSSDMGFENYDNNRSTRLKKLIEQVFNTYCRSYINKYCKR